MILYTLNTDICEMSKEKMYETVVESSNLPPAPPPCPFPKVLLFFGSVDTIISITNFCFLFKGEYELKDLTIDESFFPKVLPIGENCLELTMFLDNKIISKTRMFTDIKRT